MQGRIHWLAGLLWLTALGCVEQDETPAPAASHGKFNPDNAGTIRGRVVWEGPAPVVPSFKVYASPWQPPSLPRVSEQPNPHAPRIDPDSRGMAEVVLLLRGIAPEQARPWPHEPVRVELHDFDLKIQQGEHRSRVGFVRRGDTIEAVNRASSYHALRLRGSEFLTLPFPDADQPSRRKLDHVGRVELSSAAGYYWMAGHLFVDEHPYYARTDAEGNFVLDQVPAGEYELVCWLPSWVVVSRVRGPETGLIERISFAEPVEQSATIEVAPGQTRQVKFTWTEDRVVQR